MSAALHVASCTKDFLTPIVFIAIKWVAIVSYVSMFAK